MTMTIHTTTLSKEEFYARLAKLIGQLEGNKPQPYYDTAVPSPNPTIGIGFNLRDEGMRGEVFNAMGIPVEKRAALKAIILDTTITDPAILQSKLNTALGATFQMTDAQIAAVYEHKVTGYVDAANVSIGSGLTIGHFANEHRVRLDNWAFRMIPFDFLHLFSQATIIR
jgi:GH24 family phage-related lysozyme (muramidase)